MPSNELPAPHPDVAARQPARSDAPADTSAADMQPDDGNAPAVGSPASAAMKQSQKTEAERGGNGQ